jgi:hypothetical protein
VTSVSRNKSATKAHSFEHTEEQERTHLHLNNDAEQNATQGKSSVSNKE